MIRLLFVSALGLPLMAQALYYPIRGCRVYDSRENSVIEAQDVRSVQITRRCDVPAGATVSDVNITVLPQDKSLGYITVWDGSLPRPVISLMNSLDGSLRSNSARVSLSSEGRLSVFVTDKTHVVIDVFGYFVPAQYCQEITWVQRDTSDKFEVVIGGGESAALVSGSVMVARDGAEVPSSDYIVTEHSIVINRATPGKYTVMYFLKSNTTKVGSNE